MSKKMPSRSDLDEVLDYDPHSGAIRWIETDELAVTMHSNGPYIEFSPRVKFRAEDIAWIMSGRVHMTRIVSVENDKNESPLALVNLQPDFSKFAENTKKFRGYSFDKTRSKWRVIKSHKGITYNGGTFDTEDEAREKAQSMDEAFARGDEVERKIKTLPKYIYLTKSKKFRAMYHNGIRLKHIGTYDNLIDALEAQRKMKEKT